MSHKKQDVDGTLKKSQFFNLAVRIASNGWPISPTLHGGYFKYLIINANQMKSEYLYIPT